MANRFKYKQKMDIKGHKCELPGCNKDIPSWRHRNATTCCKEHGKELKRLREAANYQRLKDSASSSLIMYRQLSWIVDHYGYEVLVNLNDLTFLNINWAIKPDIFQRDGITGTKVQDLGFIISKPNHIIIYKL